MEAPKGMTPEDKQRIIARLNEVFAREKCPRCGNNGYILVDGYIPFSIHQSTNTLGTLIAGGPVVPSVAVACSRCGWLSFHALGVLFKESAAEAKHG